MGQILAEPVNRGLVTARDAALLQPGELQQADECLYRPGSPSLFRAPNRTLFGAIGQSIALPVGAAYATTTLTAAVASTATTLTIVTPATFGYSTLRWSYAELYVNGEHMHVLAQTTVGANSLLTVCRGYGDTAIRAHASGDTVVLVTVGFAAQSSLHSANFTATQTVFYLDGAPHPQAIVPGAPLLLYHGLVAGDTQRYEIMRIEEIGATTTTGSNTREFPLTVTRGVGGTAVLDYVTDGNGMYFAPNAYSLDTAINATDVTLHCYAAGGGANHLWEGSVAQIGQEQMLVTVHDVPIATSVCTLTVTRGYNSTRAEAHAINSVIFLPLFAGSAQYAPIKGLRVCGFPVAAQDVALAYVKDKFVIAPFADLTGTFNTGSPLRTGLADTSAETLDGFHYGTEHYLLTGGDPPQRVSYNGGASLVARRAGMEPVTTAPAAVTAAGSWPTGALFGTGYYWFLTTEVVNPGGVDETEGTFLGTPTSLQITNTATQSVTVTRSATVNDGASGRNTATHWYVYMSDRQADTSTIPPLSSFFRVGSGVSIVNTTVTLGGNQTVTGPYSPVRPVAQSPNNGTYTTTNPNNVGVAVAGSEAQDNAFAQMAHYAGTDALIGVKCGAFNAAAAGTLSGVTVEVVGRLEVTGAPGSWQGYTLPVTVQLWKSGGAVGTDKSATRTAYFNSNATSQVLSLGGDTDLWGLTLTAAQVNDNSATGFFVIVDTGATGATLSFIYNVYIDAVRIKVYSGAGAVEVQEGTFFPAVTVVGEAGGAISYPAYVAPPPAATGDVFQGQAVVNDAVHPTRIVYSLPDRPEYFPVPYYLDFRLKQSDRITCIRTLRDALLVGFQGQIKRVNYLPSEFDSSFDRGRAYEDLARDHGITGPMAATVFEMPDKGPMLAYVSMDGLHLTDGVTTTTLTDDLDWVAMVDRSVDQLSGVPHLYRAAIVSYPPLYTLFVYLRLSSGAMGALALSYHPTLVKPTGKLPVTGPITVSGRSAAIGRLQGVPKLLTGSLGDGNVYLEDHGASDAAGATPTLTVKTRQIYPSGPGEKARMNRAYLRTRLDGTSTTGALTLSVAKQETGSARQALESRSIDTSVGGLVRAEAVNEGECFDVTVTKALGTSTADFRLDAVLLEMDPEGTEAQLS